MGIWSSVHNRRDPCRIETNSENNNNHITINPNSPSIDNLINDEKQKGDFYRKILEEFKPKLDNILNNRMTMNRNYEPGPFHIKIREYLGTEVPIKFERLNEEFSKMETS